MAARGKKPTPTHLKIVKGNPGKRALNKNEPTPKRERPEKPKGMTGKAGKAWDEAVEIAYNMGVLTVADGLALRQLCEAIADEREAQRILDAYGSRTYETTTTTGSIKIAAHPAVAMKADADRRLRAWLEQFGMTPASRSRIEKAADDDEEDEAETFFG